AGAMTDEIPDPEVALRAKPPRSYSARYKAEILAEYEKLDKAGKGALLRREGGALSELAKASGRPPADPVEREVARLRRENERLAGELDKAKKVIEVQ